VDCSEFKDRYSDFADGLLDEAAEVQARRHLAECPACRRMHHAYGLGLSCLRSMPVASPSCEFVARLSRRLEVEGPDGARPPRRWSGVAAAVLLASAVAVAGLDYLERGREARRAAAAAAKRWRPVATASRPQSGTFRLTPDTANRAANPFQLLPLNTDTSPATYLVSDRVAVSAVWVSR
jgi:hypothetical protein